MSWREFLTAWKDWNQNHPTIEMRIVPNAVNWASTAAVVGPGWRRMAKITCDRMLLEVPPDTFFAGRSHAAIPGFRITLMQWSFLSRNVL